MDKYVTITRIKGYYGKNPFKIGMLIRLVKEPDKYVDAEAIAAILPMMGKIGYVANSPQSVAIGTMSSGRIYDTFADECYAEVQFVIERSVIAKIVDEAVLVTKKAVEKNEDHNFLKELFTDDELNELINNIRQSEINK